MFDHRFRVSIDFEGDVLDVPEEMSVTEVEFMLINLIKGFMFIEQDGKSVIPFDPATLNVNVKPMVKEVKHG